MANWQETLDAARAEVEAFDTEAMAMLTALLPTGNVWRQKSRPRGAGVYAIWKPGEIRPIWVGQTGNLFRRTLQHIRQGRYDPKTHALTVYQIEADEDHLRDLEDVAIEALKPTSGKQHPFRRGISARLRGFIQSLGL